VNVKVHTFTFKVQVRAETPSLPFTATPKNNSHFIAHLKHFDVRCPVFVLLNYQLITHSLPNTSRHTRWNKPTSYTNAEMQILTTISPLLPQCFFKLHLLHCETTLHLYWIATQMADLTLRKSG
jgi:hypothetical protein